MTTFRRIQQRYTRPVLASAVALGLSVGVGGVARHAQAAALPVAVPGYRVSLFAAGTMAYSKPDSIAADARHVFVGYQNNGNADGSNHMPSTVVEYSLLEQVIHTFSVPGHNDGLRIDPSTGLLWATSNEDANALLTTINLTTRALVTYRFPKTAHGGGYDDLAFMHGMIFIAASNPTLNAAGVNTHPALDKVVLRNGMLTVTPVLMGDAKATDLTTHHTVTLNEVDPDSMDVTPQGDLMLDNQGGAEIVLVHNPGTTGQTVSRLPLGTQVDDTVWATSAQGRIFVSDHGGNAVYAIRSTFTAGSAYSAAPGDSGVAGFVGSLDLTSGTLKPVVIGLSSPGGMAFIPGM